MGQATAIVPLGGSLPYGIARVSKTRWCAVRIATGELVGAEKTKPMATRDAAGRNLLAAKARWCPAHRYESEWAPSILCGATIPAGYTSVCPRADEHVDLDGSA